MSRAVSNKIEIERQKVSRSIEKTHTIVQKDMIDMSYVRLDRIQERMAASVDRRMVDYKNKLSLIGVSMGNLNPFSVMDRGYSVVESSGGLVQKTTDVELGEDIDILLSDAKGDQV